MGVQSQAELVEDFSKKFVAKQSEIAVKLSQLSQSQGANAEVIKAKANEISGDIVSLSKILHDSALFLPPYTKKMRQQELAGLTATFKEEEAKLMPKQKFGFKSMPKVLPEQPVEKGEPSSSSEASFSEIAKKPADTNFVTIEDLADTTLSYSDEEVSKTDVLVRNLTNVVLHLHGSPSTLRIQNVKNCKILCGPVATSVFVEECLSSTLFLCCQQLRTHSSADTDIYLRVRARAIIEDCDRIRFGPYNWDHPLSLKLHEATQMDPTLERYDAVDDFNWLAAGPSPHWTVIPQEERVTFPKP